MLQKRWIAAAIVSAVLGMTVPAMAETETFTAPDGVISIELPSEKWEAVQDPAKWIALSDGVNLITIDHFSNGEKLPDMTVADSHYINVYQGIFSTQNEVFIVTGSVVNQDEIKGVCDSILSLKVLKYDTKLAVKKDAPKASEFTVVPMNGTYYVTTDGLNVRLGCSTQEKVIGGLGYGQSVQVTGVVQKNGVDYGWYQVSINGGTGYVSASFVSPTAPAARETETKKESTTIFTGNARTVYDQEGRVNTVYEATDGYWYDNTGLQYALSQSGAFVQDGKVYTTYNPLSQVQCEYCGNWFLEGNEFRNHICPARDAALNPDAETEMVQCEYCGDWFEAGNVFRNHVCPARDAALNPDAGAELVQCEYCGEWFKEGNEFRNHLCPARDAALNPDGANMEEDMSYIQEQPAEDSYTVQAFYLNGNATTLTNYGSDVFYDENGTEYYSGGGTYHSNGGDVLYVSEPRLGVYGDGESHTLMRADGSTFMVESRGADFLDDRYTLYSRLDDGSYMDYYGNIYECVD